MTENRLHVRPARASDAAPIIEFCNRLWGDEPDYIGEVWDAWLAEGNLFAGTLPGDDRPCAVVRVRMLSAQEAWFGGLRVHPELHGQGAGRQLIDFAATWARQHGARTLGYMTETTNLPMLQLARKLGYTKLGTVDWRRLSTQAADLVPPPPARTWQLIDLERAPNLAAQGGFYVPGWVVQRLTPERLALHAAQGELFMAAENTAWIILIDANDPLEAALLAHAEGEPPALQELLTQALATPAAQAHSLAVMPFAESPLDSICQAFGLVSTDNCYTVFEKELAPA